MTPGKVVFQNELMQLIQYAPATETVLKTPILIVPPWINKFYILDLTPGKILHQMVRRPGPDGFPDSWVNPDASLAAKTFEDYMRKARSPRSTHQQGRPARKRCTPIGYCVGGTLLAVDAALSWRHEARHRVSRRRSFAAQVDFTYAGDLKVFVDEEQLRRWKAHEERGYLEGGRWPHLQSACAPTT
jgi:polyhydroxyalkanoate synthase